MQTNLTDRRHRSAELLNYRTGRSLATVYWPLALLATALVVLGAVQSVAADGAVSTNNTVITSDRLEFNYERLIAVFEGSVVVRSPQIRLESDKLTVLFRKDNNVRSVTAQGNVRVLQQNRTGRCRKAIYLVSEGEVIMVGEASVQQGRDLLAGEVITLWLGKERMTCHPAYLQIVLEESRPIKGSLRP